MMATQLFLFGSPEGTTSKVSAAGDYFMRRLCADCHSCLGYLERRGPHLSVFCAGCRRWQYHAPRSEITELADAEATRP